MRLPAASPDRAAFPELRAGRRPQFPFRGLLRLHSRYRPSIRSAAQGDVCRRASILPVARPHRLPATGPTDHCPGGTCTHKVIAPFGDAPEFHGGGLVGAAHQDWRTGVGASARSAILYLPSCNSVCTPCNSVSDLLALPRSAPSSRQVGRILIARDIVSPTNAVRRNQRQPARSAHATYISGRRPRVPAACSK